MLTKPKGKGAKISLITPTSNQNNVFFPPANAVDDDPAKVFRVTMEEFNAPAYWKAEFGGSREVEKVSIVADGASLKNAKVFIGATECGTISTEATERYRRYDVTCAGGPKTGAFVKIEKSIAEEDESLTLALGNVKVYVTAANADKCMVKNNNPIFKCQNWYVPAIEDGSPSQDCQVK